MADHDTPDVEARVREALATIAGPHERGELGRFHAGNQVNTITGERSAVLWHALEPAKRELVASVTRDIGGDPSTTLAGLIDGYAEARLFRQAMWLRLVEEGGAVTNKGRTRALYTAYTAAIDRELRLATTIGLERRQRAIKTALDYIDGRTGASE